MEKKPSLNELKSSDTLCNCVCTVHSEDGQDRIIFAQIFSSNYHVVYIFLGKLSDESLDSLVSELERVSTEDGEGEAARYYLHARNLKQTIQFLRSNQAFKCESDAAEDMCLPLDLVRCESLQSLDPRTASRLLSKNYA